MSDKKTLSDESLEKVVGGDYSPSVTGDAFEYNGHQCKVVTNCPVTLSDERKWCCYLDANGNATGYLIQVPTSAIPSAS